MGPDPVAADAFRRDPPCTWSRGYSAAETAHNLEPAAMGIRNPAKSDDNVSAPIRKDCGRDL